MKQSSRPDDLTVVIPARNESTSIGKLVAEVLRVTGTAPLVIDDGSEDDTAQVARAAGARVISHRYRKGNGAAIKTGTRAAQTDILVFMDGDGQHRPGDIPPLVARLREGCDLVVGARGGRSAHAGFGRWLANQLYNLLASWLVGHRVADLTSGFRAVRRAHFLPILALLPNGFSYPTTSTMSFYRAGLTVEFLPVEVQQRHGDSDSHIRPLRDGLRFLTIIFKVITLYSPLKVFAPASFALFLAGAAYYQYTYLGGGRFTNMGALLFTSSILVFFMGLIAEQITTLTYLNLSRTQSTPSTRDD